MRRLPQSILPDLNSQFLIYTREAINGWKGRNYDQATGALYAFNGLLPDLEPGKYRVLVDSNEYHAKTKQDLIATCQYCEKEVNYHSIKFFQVLLPLVKRILSKTEYEKIWVCPECHKDNELAKTKLIQKILKDPSYIAIVPKPPTKKDGIIDRTQFHTKYTVWFWTFLQELVAQAAAYRQNYKPKEGFEDEFTELEYSPEQGDTQL